MFFIIWSRSGILVPIFFALSAWLIGYAYDDTTMKNYNYMGFVFLSTSILVFLHAFMIKASQHATDENGQVVEGPKKRHTFFFIPVFYWALITAALCILCFVYGARTPSVKHSRSNPSSDTEDVDKNDDRPTTRNKRTINFLNPTADTLYYYLSTPDGEEKKGNVYPNNYLSVEVDAGKYLIGSFDMNDDLVYGPKDDFKSDKEKYERIEDKKGKVFYYRIIHPGGDDDSRSYNEAWFVMDGEKQMALIDVTEICYKGRTEKEIKKINWAEKVKEVYNSKDLIEPMQLTATEESIAYTILNLGEDIPKKITNDQEVYMLMSYSPGKKLTDVVIEDRILSRIGD